MPALDGRTVLVTGASTGIGRTTALMLAELGATVLAGVRDPAAGEALGPTVTPVQLDVTNPDDIAALDLERLDGLVNNAGIAVSGPLEFLPVAELRHQLEVNVIAQLAVTQACLPALRAVARPDRQHLLDRRAASRCRSTGRTRRRSSRSRRSATRCAASCAAPASSVSLVEPGAIATPIWDRGIAAADALWDAMPPVAHERYGTLVATLRGEAEQQGVKGEPPEAVARIVVTALTAAQAAHPLRDRARRAHPGRARPRAAGTGDGRAARGRAQIPR